jgi:hypothetical protein
MLKMTTQNATPNLMVPKRISPELAEVLHMLKALEGQPAKAQSVVATR